MRPLRWPRLWGFLAFLGLGCTLACSFWPAAAPLPGHLPDKAQHVVGYAVFAFFFAGLVRPRYVGLVALASFGFGGLMELGQLCTPTRTADWHDAAANGLGVVLALVLIGLGAGHWVEPAERLIGRLGGRLIVRRRSPSRWL